MRRPLFIVLIVVAALLLAVLSLPFLIDANQFRPAIEAELAKSLGRVVKIGDLKLSILSGTVTADDLSVTDDPAFSQSSFLHTKALKLSVDLWQVLFSRKLHVNEITIDTPEAILIQLPSGVWNFSSLGTKSPRTSSSENLTLAMKSLNIRGARLSLTQGHGPPRILDDVTIQVTDFAPDSAFPFSLSAKMPGGGTVAMEGKAGPINQADAANTPITASLKVTNLGIAASGAVASSAGIDGVVSADGTVNSNGQILDVTAKVKAEKLKLAPRGTPTRNPLLIEAAFTENLKQHSGQLTRGEIAIGGVKASLTGAWTSEGESNVLKMVLSAPTVPVSGLEELLPSFDVRLPSGSTLEGGTASANLAISGPPTALTISGPVDVSNTRLKGFDLGANMSPIETLAGIKSGPNTEIQTLSASLRITPEMTSLQNIRLLVPSLGDITGSGTISPAKALNFKMRAAVHANLVVSALGPANIPFSIVGTSSNPQFRPDVGQIATEELNRRLSGVKAGGLDVGKASEALQGLFGGKK
jgi:AsmA protein